MRVRWTALDRRDEDRTKERKEDEVAFHNVNHL